MEGAKGRELFYTPDHYETFKGLNCCGMKYGRNPLTKENAQKYRDTWLQHPVIWSNPAAKPNDWKIEDQMEHIPADYV